MHPRKCAVFKGNEHLSSLLHYVIALREGADPVKLVLQRKGKWRMCMQCVDPGEPYTNGGTVVFEIITSSEEDRIWRFSDAILM